MELRQLKYFLEAVKQNSITKASEQLHISQPALSKMIKSLEEELGMPLLFRSNKTSEITDAGQIVFEYAQKILSHVDEMTSTLNDMTSLMRGQINIGIPPIIGSLFFPKVLASFHLEYPNVKMNITEYGAARIVKSVEEGEFELGVVVLPVDERSFQTYPIVWEELKLVVPKQHRLSKQEVVQLNELKDEEFIFYNEEFALYDIIRNKCIDEGFIPNIIFKSSQWDFMSEMVAANLGITILPESICRRVKDKNVNILTLRPVIPWHLALITKKGRYISFAGRAFIEFLQKAFHYN
ncbi:LysR family transcriptional regulator [Peribacillus cavernae]|uniref:LysR family transcriptional regulator n=1 Tax=Peribacillus cavernae TaxID=1674310 RepID=A0A3S0U646_9BACI|nr:LysR family transcriptional regulator [Peribacillus cavernae]MDQ0218804.1 DNA-binding transcriptional LysR family regulator [Peribacillus cavernae]RUQ31013.1 LysR family transcriptional regulator [Peribacillus cavernae]